MTGGPLDLKHGDAITADAKPSSPPKFRSERAALRPKPINIPSKPSRSSSGFKVLPPSKEEGNGRYDEIHGLNDAELQPWSQGVTTAHRAKRIPSPSISSRYTARQSDISLGIIDYYLREPSLSLYSPAVPPPTPSLDPAIDKFEFGLTSSPTLPTIPISNAPSNRPSIDKPRKQALIPQSPPIQPAGPKVSQRQAGATAAKSYKLFPVIKEVTPPPRRPAITIFDGPTTLQDRISTKQTVSTPATLPSPTYRPRKESLSSSIRTRKDSIITTNNANHIPLRPIRSNSTASSHHIASSKSETASSFSPRTPTQSLRFTSSSTSTSTPHSRLPSSHDLQSRWSDDTPITSPSSAPIPGLRTSFGSLLRRNNMQQQQYPACFFDYDEDDYADESAPLRRKFGWGRNERTELLEWEKGNDEKRNARSFGGNVARWVVCGGLCCSRGKRR